MLTARQLELLEAYLDFDPRLVALKTGDREVAEQVAVLQKARIKLPALYDARCFISPISYEQCTSEIVAANRRFPSGELAIDLTCGLGVDTLALAKSFKKVVTCEIDTDKAVIARSNFERLGVRNVEVRNCAAEDFLADFSGKADLIFCDPSRRSSIGSKVSALQDCAPNIIELWHSLKEISSNIMVKLSPLFDVDELFNIFGNEIEVETVSHNNECKEVVMRWGSDIAQANRLSVTIIRGETVVHQSFLRSSVKSESAFLLEQARYIFIPDVAFAKSRTVGHYMDECFGGVDYLYDSFLLTDRLLEDFVGRGFEIQRVMSYKPKEAKRFLAEMKIKKATLHLKNFPYSIGEIKKQLNIGEGADAELFMFRLSGLPIMCVVG